MAVTSRVVLQPNPNFDAAPPAKANHIPFSNEAWASQVTQIRVGGETKLRLQARRLVGMVAYLSKLKLNVEDCQWVAVAFTFHY